MIRITPGRSPRLRMFLLALALGAATPLPTLAHESPKVPISDLSRRIAAHPDSVALVLVRAELRRIDGDLEGARADLTRVERLAPGLAALPLARAALALDEGDPAAARALLDRSLLTGPVEPAALRLRARAAAALGDSRAAIADLGAVIARVDRPHPDLFLERARLQVTLGDAEGARAGLDEARARLGVTASLELFAIELELESGRPDVANARLASLRAQYDAPEVLAPLAARIDAASRSFAARPDDDDTRPALAGETAAGDPQPQVALAGATSVTTLAGQDLRPGQGPSGAEAAQATVTRGPYLQVGSPDAVTIRWRTDTPTESWVRYGFAYEHRTLVASDATLTTEHEVRLKGLTQGTRYYYSIGTAAGPIAGDGTYTFKTAPAPGYSSGTRLWVIGDSGLPGSTANAVRDAYARWTGPRETDLWLMLGDNAYSTGTDSEYQAAVFQQYPRMLRQSVLWPTRGNHDALYSGANNDYYDIFTLPTKGEAGGLASGTEAYYSFDWGDVHFIGLDSEGSSRSPSGAMLTWLVNDLAANKRKWLIAFWHHPPYTKGSHDSDDSGDSGGRMRDMRQNALPILEAAGVDLVLTGHSHSYERSFLVDGHYGSSGTLSSSMVVDGGDGRPNGDGAYFKGGLTASSHDGAVYAVAGSSSKTSGGSLDHPVMVTSLNVAGSLVLDINDDTLEARFLDSRGAVRDSFRIEKPRQLDAPGNPAAGTGVRLGPGLPNPFAGDVRIGYTLVRAGRVRLDVHDLAGRRVASLEDGWREAGPHEVRWDGRDSQGRPLAGGIYLTVLEANGERVSRKISHLK